MKMRLHEATSNHYHCSYLKLVVHQLIFTPFGSLHQSTIFEIATRNSKSCPERAAAAATRDRNWFCLYPEQPSQAQLCENQRKVSFGQSV